MQAIRRQLERENELEDRLLRERDEVRDIIELVSMTICSLRHSKERARAAKESSLSTSSMIEVKIDNSNEAGDDDEEDEENGFDTSHAFRKKRRYVRKSRDDGESIQSNDAKTRDDESSDQDEEDDVGSEERMGGGGRQLDHDSGAVEKYMIESSTVEATNDPYKQFVNSKIEAVLDGIPRDMTGGLKKQLGLEYARRKNREMTDREWKEAKDVFLQMMSTVLIRIRKHNPHGYLYTPCIRHRHEKVKKNNNFSTTKPSPCWCDGTTFRKKDVRSIRELTTTLLNCYLNNYLEGGGGSSSSKSSAANKNNKDSKTSSTGKRARLAKPSRDSTSSSSSQ